MIVKVVIICLVLLCIILLINRHNIQKQNSYLFLSLKESKRKHSEEMQKKIAYYNALTTTTRDTRLKMYIDRLFTEWKTHGKIIIGVDFDNTISPYHTLDNSADIERTIALLKVCQQTGCYIVIHTSCREDRHIEIKEYCGRIGIKIDSINQTPIDLPYGKSGSKPYCNHFLDDRAALPISLDILEFAMYKMRGYQNKTNIEIFLA